MLFLSVVHMKKLKRSAALALVLGLIISLCGCSLNEVGKYQIVDRLQNQSFCIGFRSGDKVGTIVTSALEELEASGKLRELSIKWLGEDVSMLSGDDSALDLILPSIEPRTLIVGCDGGRLPFSGADENGELTGFDVELAREVCKLLGWQLKLIAIDVSEAEVELNSGNVDCVWGGFAYDASYTQIDLSPVYMKNTIVLVSLSGSGIRSARGLSGKALTLSENCYFNAVLDANETLKNRPSIINRIPGGTAACIDSLNNEGCDAIIADIYSLDYYR